MPRTLCELFNFPAAIAENDGALDSHGVVEQVEKGKLFLLCAEKHKPVSNQGDLRLWQTDLVARLRHQLVGQTPHTIRKRRREKDHLHAALRDVSMSWDGGGLKHLYSSIFVLKTTLRDQLLDLHEGSHVPFLLIHHHVHFVNDPDADFLGIKSPELGDAANHFCQRACEALRLSKSNGD